MIVRVIARRALCLSLKKALPMAIGSARSLEDATRIAYNRLVLWLEKQYGFDRWDYMMPS